MKIPSDGSNNLIFLDRVKKRCVSSSVLEKGPSGLKVLVPINSIVKRSLLLQYRREFEDQEQEKKM